MSDFESELKDLINKHSMENGNKALELITTYGGIGGDHHKQWLIDQLVRLLAPDYEQWVKDYENGADGVKTYIWDIGIDP